MPEHDESHFRLFEKFTYILMHSKQQIEYKNQTNYLCFGYILYCSSKGKIIKKVNKQLVGLITKCFEEGKDMQIVVICGIVDNDMNWEVSGNNCKWLHNS